MRELSFDHGRIEERIVVYRAYTWSWRRRARVVSVGSVTAMWLPIHVILNDVQLIFDEGLVQCASVVEPHVSVLGRVETPRDDVKRVKKEVRRHQVNDCKGEQHGGSVVCVRLGTHFRALPEILFMRSEDE